MASPSFESMTVLQDQLGAQTCLVTVTDDGFVDGTEVLLLSFLRCHPRFSGTIVVFVAGTLSSSARARLLALAPVRFHSPGADLRRRVDALTRAIPELAAAAPRFASLEAFGLHEFERVLYLDSDVCVTGDLSRLLDGPEPLLACGDGNTYDEWLDPGLDQGAACAANARRYGAPLSGCFNAGVLAVGPPLLRSGLRDELVAMIDPATWAGVTELGWTDQLILNRRLAGTATLLDGRYNYMPTLEAKIRRAHGLVFTDARLVHMAGRIKPWQRRERSTAASARSLDKFFELWDQLAELVPGRADDSTLADRVAGHARQMHALMRPRTERAWEPAASDGGDRRGNGSSA